jgi:hypothetical protein
MKVKIKHITKTPGKMKGLVLYTSKHASWFLDVLIPSKIAVTKKARYREPMMHSVKFSILFPSVNINQLYLKFKGFHNGH